jgi:hypothetical protein
LVFSQYGTGRWIRTTYAEIFNLPLYQLSYSGMVPQ